MSNLSQATLDAIAQAVTLAVAQALAPVATPVQPSAASGPAATFDATGRTCVCGHEHARPVVSGQRHRLPAETACAVKGCVSTSCGR